MKAITQYRVISESEGWITEYGTEETAQERADELNQEHGIPSDHYVKEVTEQYE